MRRGKIIVLYKRNCSLHGTNFGSDFFFSLMYNVFSKMIES